MYDVTIIGTGPSGLTSLLYSCLYGLHALCIGQVIGGKLLHAPDIIDYPGVTSIHGKEFIQKLQEQISLVNGEIVQDTIVTINKEPGRFFLKTKSEKLYESQTIIIATGNGTKEKENSALVFSFQLSLPIDHGHLVSNKDQSTTVPGVFACGDCLTYPDSTEQLGTVIGTSIQAAAGVYEYLKHAKPPILWAMLKFPGFK